MRLFRGASFLLGGLLLCLTLSAQEPSGFDAVIRDNAKHMADEGKQTFRFDTFGDESFWGDTLRLHEAIEGQKLGGVGPGVSPATALAVGLKVDVDALPASVIAALREGKVHSTVDDSFAPGIGHRLDGWANRDLNVGAITSLAPNLQPAAALLGTDVATVRKVLAAWGPGKFDAELFMDGKGFRPDGKSSAVLIPPAFGLAGVNLHTWTGWGSVTYWNAFVGNLEMHGKGTFFDARLNNAAQFPVAAAAGFGNVRNTPDLITEKLGALQFYQLAIPAPKPPKGSFDEGAAERGKELFAGQAKCATCHVPPLFTEPGWNLHTPEEIGVDDFQASRAPDKRYRTPPLKGLWTHTKGGYFHDGRFSTLGEVVQHYNGFFGLGLSDQQVHDLVEYLKSL
ncbi:MAG: c-type cytochrome [Gammaproteobacteria bacterium]|nr:MAG: c-type cytochrome [Gammaproteobacteria bacterium]